MPTTLSQNINGRQFVEYQDLSGGLNTKRSPHRLERNQLASSVNCWNAFENSLSKRPGSTAFGSTSGATGSGVFGRALGTCRFNNLSYVLVLQGTTVYYSTAGSTSWTSIGTLNASATNFSIAQQYDPGSAADTVWIADGLDTPQAWQGPGHSIVAATSLAGAVVPNNYTNTATFTPTFAATLGLNSHLFYAGEPTCPSAVFVSDPNYPNSFTTPITAASPYAGAYKPALVGFNDGVNGGSITGMAPMGPAMIIYKQAAIYAMVQEGILGDLVFGTVLVSSSIGCLSPNSIVPFDTFHCFLGVDGVYTTDGTTTTRISDSVPTFFDSSLSGFPAIIGDRTTAVGVRSGQRYLIFFTDTAGAVNNRGLWFDFSKPDVNGYPTAGEIQNMSVAGAKPLRGPADDGNFIWADGSQDRIGKFGLGFSDFGNAIATQFAGKADLMDDVFPNDGGIRVKNVDDMQLLVSIPQQAGVAQSYVFSATVITDLLMQYTSQGAPINIAPAGAGVWGVGLWGTMVWSSASGSSNYASLKTDAKGSAQGHVIQIGVSEQSIYPWRIIGFVLEITGMSPD
jgi:hypothetical protein